MDLNVWGSAAASTAASITRLKRGNPSCQMYGEIVLVLALQIKGLASMTLSGELLGYSTFCTIDNIDSNVVRGNALNSNGARRISLHSRHFLQNILLASASQPAARARAALGHTLHGMVSESVTFQPR